MIWPLLTFASLAVNIAAMVRVGSREPKKIITFGVGMGADIDSARAETDSYVDTGKLYARNDGPADYFFDDDLWLDEDSSDPQEVDAFDDAIEANAGEYGTTETDLWNRPDLVGGWLR
jgi:hypothetical protein